MMVSATHDARHAATAASAALPPVLEDLDPRLGRRRMPCGDPRGQAR